MERKKVLVAGATGYLGKYVVQEFAARGYTVRALVRNPEKLATIGPNLEPAVSDVVKETITGDARDLSSLHDACKDIDIVFSCMGLTMPQDNVTSEQVDHLGNKALLKDALRHGVEKFIYVSVYNAEHMPDVEIVQAHERFVQDLEASGMPFTLIRPTGFFSDMGMLLSMARSGISFILGEGTNKINPIHGADLAKVCVDAAENKEREIAVGGPDTYTFNETITMAFEALGKTPMLVHIPSWVGETALFVTGLVNKPVQSALSFAVAVNKMDNVAPATGARHLEEFYRELCKEMQK